MEILGIITARGGSKGIPGKNTKELLGKPLIAYTIEAAKKSGVISRLVVSTDDDKIAEIGKLYGAEIPFLRPAELAGDLTPTLPVLLHTISWFREKENYSPDYVMLLQPTAPLRQPFHIREAVELMKKDLPDSVISVSPVPGHHNPHWQFRIAQNNSLAVFTGEQFSSIVPRRQELPQTYTRNGAIYLFRTELLFRNPPSFYGNDVRAYVMEEKYGINIDSPKDWDQAETALKNILQA